MALFLWLCAACITFNLLFYLYLNHRHKLYSELKKVYIKVSKRSRFKPGDEVYFTKNIYLVDVIKAGTIHIVTDIAFSPCCGVEWVSIGVAIPSRLKGICKRCLKCHKGALPMPDGKHIYFEAVWLEKVEDIEIVELTEFTKRNNP